MTDYEYLEAAIVNPGDDCIVWERGLGSSGYGQVRANGKPRGAHLVALELTTPRPAGKVCTVKGNWVEGNKLEAAHGPCHTRLCFNSRHLSWKTRAENQADRKRDGTTNDGERNGFCTIPSDVVDAIKAEYKGPQNRMKPKSGPTQEELAKKYGCSRTQVSYIVTGKWRKVA